jgi:hypothetical protein
MPHAPFEQPAVAFAGAEQDKPQAPQLETSLATLFSQPSATLPLQFPKFASQLPMPQTPPKQPAEPFAGMGHTTPHAPQLFASVETFCSQPSAAMPLQFA